MMYAAYGLKIRSDTELPLLKSAGEEVHDVVIRVGNAPGQIDPVINKGVYFRANSHEFLLNIPGTGAIYVREGKEVWMDPEPGQTDMLKLYLLSSALGALFQQRGLLTLHASCVTNHKHTILLTGISGSGKSTVSGALLKEGFAFVSDDICLLTEQEGRFTIQSGAPYMKLWQDALEKLDIDHKSLQHVREGIAKYYYNPPGVKDTRLTVSHIFALQSHNKPQPQITEVSGIQKFSLMKNNLLRPNYLKDTDNHPAIFQQYNRFLSRARVYRLQRPSGHRIHPQLIPMILHATQ